METTDMGGNIAGIEAEIVTMTGTRGIAGARIPDLAARDGATIEAMIPIPKTATAVTRRDGGIIREIESILQVVGGKILKSGSPEVTVMIHIGTAMAAATATVATDPQIPTVEETVLGSAPRHTLALTGSESANMSVTMPDKIPERQRNRHGSWLP